MKVTLFSRFPSPLPNVTDWSSSRLSSEVGDIRYWLYFATTHSPDTATPTPCLPKFHGPDHPWSVIFAMGRMCWSACGRCVRAHMYPWVHQCWLISPGIAPLHSPSSIADLLSLSADVWASCLCSPLLPTPLWTRNLISPWGLAPHGISFKYSFQELFIPSTLSIYNPEDSLVKAPDCPGLGREMGACFHWPNTFITVAVNELQHTGSTGNV